MTTYTLTDSGRIAALAAAGQDQRRLLYTAAGIVVMAPAPAPEVPQEVTMRQARLSLLAAGKLAAVIAAINALPDPPRSAALLEGEYSSTVRRASQFLAPLGPALGLDAAGLDALFIAAARL